MGLVKAISSQHKILLLLDTGYRSKARFSTSTSTERYLCALRQDILFGNDPESLESKPERDGRLLGKKENPTFQIKVRSTGI